MDLTLTTSSAPFSLAIPAIIWFASSASRAQWTSPPARHGLFELQEVLVEVAHDAFLEGASCLPEPFPVRHLIDGDGAFVADSLGGLPEVAP